MLRLQKRMGLTRIEAVVMVAISCLVLGLFLAGTVRFREASARAKCQNNLKEIALAAHNYASAHDTLPPGWLGPFPTTQTSATATTEMQAIGSLCFLLPHLKQIELYEQLVASAPAKNYFDPKAAYPAWYNLGPGTNGLSMLSLATTEISTFLCPSDHAPQRINGCILWQWGPISEGENSVPQNFNIYTSSQNAYLGRTNYTGIGGLDQNFYKMDQHKEGSAQWLLAVFDGLMTNRSGYSLEQVTSADGTANTLLFGEVLGDSDGSATNQIGYSVSWMCGSYPIYSGIPTGDLPYPTGSARCYWSMGSRHREIVQFAMADGSVRHIKKGVRQFDTKCYQDNISQFGHMYKVCPDCMFGAMGGWRDGTPLYDSSD